MWEFLGMARKNRLISSTLRVPLAPEPTSPVSLPSSRSSSFRQFVETPNGGALNDRQADAVAAGRDAPSAGLVSKRISAQRSDPRSIELDIGSRDIRIARRIDTARIEHKGGGRRQSISGFTSASARRLLFTARNFPGLTTMLTLTYPREFPMDGRRIKDHWRRMRQWLVRNGCPVGLWFLEFQDRGAPHFHIFMPTRVHKDKAAEAWYRIVGSGDVRHLWAGTRVESLRVRHAAGAYAAKYASKARQKEVPADFENVGRFWGTWGRAEVAAKVVLPHSEGSRIVRVLRLAYRKERAEWQRARKFKDRGRAGFTAWEVSRKTARFLALHLSADSLRPLSEILAEIPLAVTAAALLQEKENGA